MKFLSIKSLFVWSVGEKPVMSANFSVAGSSDVDLGKAYSRLGRHRGMTRLSRTFYVITRRGSHSIKKGI